MDVKYINIKNQLFEQAKKRVRPCMKKGCNQSAIKSHVLQKNGILNRVSQEGCIVEFGIHPFDKHLFKFRKVGLDNLNNPFIFRGFCGEHDREIFESIEKNQANYNEYKNQLLISYRGLLYEKRKKEILKEWNESRLAHKELSKQEDRNKLKDDITGYEEAIRDCDYLIEKMQEDLLLEGLEGSLEKFVFFTKSISKIPICSSAVFTYETTDEMESMSEDELLTEIFLTTFPTESETLFIMGYLAEKQNKCQTYISDIFSKQNEEFLMVLSSLLLGQIETWITSSSFYETHLKPIENDIGAVIRDIVLPRTNERELLPINIFKNWK